MSEREEQSVQAVRVKVPPFWPDEPALWFAQLEGQFALANITVDATKYNYVIANLDIKYITEIKDIIKNPPAADKYEKVKAELIARLSVSQEQRVRQLLTHEDIGDRKPSQFLRHLQNLAGPNVPDDFVRSLWSSRLPTHIQVILASQQKSTLEELAKLADTVSDVIGTQQVHELAAPTANDEVCELKRAIDELTRQVAAMSSPPHAQLSRARTRPNERHGWRHRSRSPAYNPAADTLCWYHRKFREKSTKCREPCFFSRNSVTGNESGSQ
ncbi:uncharacterized protein LOC128199315 [Bicyclus anynana]|uniref:Uncharacterized protein LOC128199315 n=1 Tax=Bicyclus anynana TaxID=110368 RepID=A0ABM3LYV4_BICAN|nr:uncharacterized protein LOC128199315 [Bicyclus anynana]